MPGRLKVRILSGRDFPIMDRASELTDAFVEIRFAGDTFKTDVCKKSLNPQWNSEWFKFEAEDEVLQDEPLDLRILDYDTYSAHDAIGKVYIDLKPLLTREAPHIISGWFPIFDTMHGIRGELNLQVRVELFSDFNKFRQSSCGIQFFSTCEVPTGWCIQEMLGFVEELVVNDDPEYQWIDKIRTPRASNEARQRLFSKLSGELQRKLGVKVLELGGDAVLGYHQNFDLEGESGIVVRAIGTAVLLTRLFLEKTPPIQTGHISPAAISPSKDLSVDDDHPAPPLTLSQHVAVLQSGPTDSPTIPSSAPVVGSVSSISSSPACNQQQTTTTHNPQQRHSVSPVRNVSNATAIGKKRRVSESEVGSPPRADSLGSSEGSGGHGNNSSTSQNKSSYYNKSSLQQSIDLVEYPFFTMRTFPVGFIASLGGVVSSRSVKLLDKIHNPEEPETRDAWWSELRMEIKAHANKLSCHAVLGYQEQTTICDDVIILSAMGTAAKVNLDFNYPPGGRAPPITAAITSGTNQLILSPTTNTSHTNVDKAANKDAGAVGGGGGGGVGGGDISSSSGEGEKSSRERHLYVDIGLANEAQARSLGLITLGHEEPATVVPQCSLCHIPYNASSLPFDVQLSKCAVCRKKFVPEVLFTTIDPPEEMPIWSRGCLIQARLCRSKTKIKNSEQSAREVSDSLPFLEYEVHNQLINKLKIRGLNCLFGLKIQFSIGENLMTAVATATGTYLGPLPPPPMPKLTSQGATAQESEGMVMLQKRFEQTVHRHRDRLMLDVGHVQLEHSPIASSAQLPEGDTDNEEEEEADSIVLEKTRDKNTFVLVVDDIKDESVPIMLQDWLPPDGFEICNTQRPPGIQADRVDRSVQMFTEMVRAHYSPTTNTGLEFGKIFDTILRRLCFKLRHFKPCALTDICFNVDLPDEDRVNVAVTGCCLSLHEASLGVPGSVPTSVLPTQTANSTTKYMHPLRQDLYKRNSAHINQTDDMMFSLDGLSDATTAHTTSSSTPASAPPTAATTTTTTPSTSPPSLPHSASNTPWLSRTASHSHHSMKKPKKIVENPICRGIEVTPLNVVHTGHITNYLGYYNFFFIRESTAVRETGGIGGFVQSFLVEVLSILRAHVKSLGGNGLVAFHMAHLILDNNAHKNQGQCLINVSGDIVTISDEEEHTKTLPIDGDGNGMFHQDSTSIPVPSSSST